MLLMHLTKIFHIPQKLIHRVSKARKGDMKTGENDDSCNYRRNKRK